MTYDPELRHSDRTMYEVLSGRSFPSRRCYDSIVDLADLLGTDRHQVQRSLARLKTCGHITIGLDEKNKHRFIELTSDVFAHRGTDDPTKVVVGKKLQCVKCNRFRLTDDYGICAICSKQHRSDVFVREFLEGHGPMVFREVWSEAHANFSGMGRVGIKKAYVKLMKELFNQDVS